MALTHPGRVGASSVVTTATNATATVTIQYDGEIVASGSKTSDGRWFEGTPVGTDWEIHFGKQDYTGERRPDTFGDRGYSLSGSVTSEVNDNTFHAFTEDFTITSEITHNTAKSSVVPVTIRSRTDHAVFIEFDVFLYTERESGAPSLVKKFAAKNVEISIDDLVRVSGHTGADNVALNAISFRDLVFDRAVSDTPNQDMAGLWLKNSHRLNGSGIGVVAYGNATSACSLTYNNDGTCTASGTNARALSLDGNWLTGPNPTTADASLYLLRLGASYAPGRLGTSSFALPGGFVRFGDGNSLSTSRQFTVTKSDQGLARQYTLMQIRYGSAAPYQIVGDTLLITDNVNGTQPNMTGSIEQVTGGSGTASCGFIMNGDGTYTYASSATGETAPPTNWFSPTTAPLTIPDTPIGSPTDYGGGTIGVDDYFDVRLTQVSKTGTGTVRSSALNTWTKVNAAPYYYLDQTAEGTSSAEVRVEIKRSGPEGSSLGSGFTVSTGTVDVVAIKPGASNIVLANVTDSVPIEGSTGSSAITAHPDGTVTAGATNALVGNWFEPKTANIGAHYQIRATKVNAGDPSPNGNPLDTWITLTNDVNWVLTSSSPATSALTVEIRELGHTVILGTATWTFDVTAAEPSESIVLANASASDLTFGGGQGTVWLEVGTDGTMSGQGGIAVVSPDWLDPTGAGVGSNYEISARLFSGDPPTGGPNLGDVWHNLGTARRWTLTTSNGTSNLKVKIRRVGDPDPGTAGEVDFTLSVTAT